MRIYNVTRGAELAGDAFAARSVWKRTVGLLGRAGLDPGEALLIEPCSSIHTAFMRFAIDVLYLNRAGQVVKAVGSMKPFRLSAKWVGAHSVIELPSGAIAASGTEVGDQLTLDDQPTTA
ncbi:MAG: DUF192 domain-containing protein [Dehalococcoidia bacterium]